MATNNNDLSTRYYEPQYKGILASVFEAQKAFENAFAEIQTTDGVAFNETAFTVKTNATPVVVGTTYSKDPNVAFGTGTGSSSRFGNRTEIIYADTPVNYSYEMVIHEGIDRNTVNVDFDQAIADRLEVQSQAQTRTMNVKNGKFLSDSAGTTFNLADYTEDSVKKLFNDANKLFVNNEVTATKTAYLVPDLYQAIVDMTNMSTLKGATINIDEGSVIKYKGFVLKETPDQYFQTGEVSYFSADKIAVPFVGISTARTIDSEDFDGKALQGLTKGGQYINEDNKKALAKAVLGTAQGASVEVD